MKNALNERQRGVTMGCDRQVPCAHERTRTL